MEYSLKFIIIYVLLQIAVTLGGYFYYYSFLRKMYLMKRDLPFFIGFSQLLIFLSHGITLHLPYYLFTSWPRIYVSNGQFIAGLILAVISLIILFGGFINLGVFAKTMGTKAGSLSTGGIYKISRNPQVIGYGLFLVSYAVLWPSWYIILALISFFIIIHRMVLTEEIHLRNVFGEEYMEYCKKTPRYL